MKNQVFQIPTGIKAIIFDLGGVLVNLETERTLKEFQRLGIGQVDFNTHPGNQPDFFSLYEKGLMTDAHFIAGLAAHMEEGTSSEAIVQAWNEMILDLPAHRLDFLLELRKKYKLYLLSNTNKLHIEYFLESFRRQHPERCFEDYFDKIYYSHEIGKRKPDLDSFEFVLEDNQLEAKDCLFIDDNLVNTEAAHNLGITSIHHPRNEEIADFLKV